MDFTLSLPVAAAAVVIETVAGYPPTIFRAIRHPVMWVGALIGWLDMKLNQPHFPDSARRGLGVVALLVILLLVGGVTLAIQAAARLLSAPFGALGLAILSSSLLAGRSLSAHVRAVADGLNAAGVAGGRAAVAHIVGRDTAGLDEAGVARAAIESLAENFADGVVAPLLWCALLGLPGIALFKAINTADSMIGHRTTRHAAFGWAAARLDDVVNLPASRLAAWLLAIAAALHADTSGKAALRAVWRDAGRHRSPNAGWPEAAMAGALGLRLAGPRVYREGPVDDAWMGDGTASATAADIERALSLYRVASLVQIVAIGTLATISLG